jgi:hypothetical protein
VSGNSGTPLERAQIIEVWVDGGGMKEIYAQ